MASNAENVSIWWRHHVILPSRPAYWRSRSGTVCFTCARNIGFQQAKITFVLMLSSWCVFHVFGCALFVYHLRSYKYWIRVCLLWVYVIINHTKNSNNGFKSARREHENSRTHASTKWIARNIFQWQFDKIKTFLHENAYVVCKISSILFRPQYIVIQSWTWKNGNMCPQLGNTWRQISLLVYEHRQRVKIPKTSMKGRYSHMKQYIYI